MTTTLSSPHLYSITHTNPYAPGLQPYISHLISNKMKMIIPH